MTQFTLPRNFPPLLQLPFRFAPDRRPGRPLLRNLQRTLFLPHRGFVQRLFSTPIVSPSGGSVSSLPASVSEDSFGKPGETLPRMGNRAGSGGSCMCTRITRFCWHTRSRTRLAGPIEQFLNRPLVGRWCLIVTRLIQAIDNAANKPSRSSDPNSGPLPLESL